MDHVVTSDDAAVVMSSTMLGAALMLTYLS
jgi:hypothetical protein